MELRGRIADCFGGYFRDINRNSFELL